MSATPCLVVFDQSRQAPARTLCAQFGIPGAPLEAATALAAGPATIVFDVDIRSRPSIEACKRLRPQRPAGQSWLFLLDGSGDLHAARTQAYALGATETLKRDAAPAKLARLLAAPLAYPVAGRDLDDLAARPGGRAVESAGRLLSGLFTAVADRKAISAAEVRRGAEQLARSLDEAEMGAWLDTVRSHHEGTFQHCLLVSAIAGSYARAFLGKAEGERLITAAILHDIGKAEVPLHILDKPSGLTPEEFEVIARHPVVAYERLRHFGLPDEVLAAVRGHHETLDGAGYPDGLSGDSIGRLTRILAVCDVYGALTESRSYRAPTPPDEAVAILVEMALRNKLDYEPIRNLASLVEVHVPATLAEVIANLEARPA